LIKHRLMPADLLRTVQRMQCFPVGGDTTTLVYRCSRQRRHFPVQSEKLLFGSSLRPSRHLQPHAGTHDAL